MLFEIFLLIGITLCPISLLITLFGLLNKIEKVCYIGVAVFGIGVLLLCLALWLPAIPIIPQG